MTVMFETKSYQEPQDGSWAMVGRREAEMEKTISSSNTRTIHQIIRNTCMKNNGLSGMVSEKDGSLILS